MNAEYKINYFSGGDDFFGPNYGEARVYSVVPPDYGVRCQNVRNLRRI